MRQLGHEDGQTHVAAGSAYYLLVTDAGGGAQRRLPVNKAGRAAAGSGPPLGCVSRQ